MFPDFFPEKLVFVSSKNASAILFSVLQKFWEILLSLFSLFKKLSNISSLIVGSQVLRWFLTGRCFFWPFLYTAANYFLFLKVVIMGENTGSFSKSRYIFPVIRWENSDQPRSKYWATLIGRRKGWNLFGTLLSLFLHFLCLGRKFKAQSK